MIIATGVSAHKRRRKERRKSGGGGMRDGVKERRRSLY